MLGGHAGDNRMADHIGSMSTGGKIWQVRGLFKLRIHPAQLE